MLRLSLRNALAAIALAAMSISLISCSDDDKKIDDPDLPKNEDRPGGESNDAVGQYSMFVLNEGQMGMNNSSIDVLNLDLDSYTQDVYGAANPSEVIGLGDTGNDIIVAGDMLYAVINGANKVEVINANNCKRLGQIDVNAPRYAVAHGGYLYVSSWMGGATDQGSVVKVDLATNQPVASVGVGIHPEQMAVQGGKLYVTSSQDYATGEFDNKLYVVNLSSFNVERTIEAGLNQTQIQADDNGNLNVVAAGNYADIASNVYEVNPATATITPLNIAATKLVVNKGTGYVLATTYDENSVTTNTISSINLATLAVRSLNLEKFGDILNPRAIAVDPADGTLYVSDARDYTSRGRIFAYNPADGSLLATYTAGVNPGHFAFYQK